MSEGQRGRLLGSGILILLAGTLALAACNSNSVSGNQSKPSTSTSTAAESKAPSSATGSQPKGLIDAALSKTQ